jgi:cytochrome b561
MVVAHMSIGILLAAVVIARIAWRVSPAHKVRPAWAGPTEWLASGVHWLLYLLLVAEAVLGLLLRWSGNEAMSLFGLQIPPPFEPWSKPTHLPGRKGATDDRNRPVPRAGRRRRARQIFLGQ